MPAPLASARHPLWLFTAAILSVAGSGALLELGRAAEGVSTAVGGGPAALGLVSVVVLLAASGLVLAAMGAKELLDQRRQTLLR